MNLIQILAALAAVSTLSSCAMSTPLQKAMGQRMQQSAMMGGTLGAAAGPQPSAAFQSFYH